MHRFCKLGLIASLQLFSWITLAAAPAQMDSLKFITDSQHSRLLFRVPSTVSRGMFLLSHPSRLVIDFKDTQLTHPLKQPPADHPIFLRIRSAQRQQNDLRVVVDLKKNFSAQEVRIIADKNVANSWMIELLNPETRQPIPKVSKPVLPIKSMLAVTPERIHEPTRKTVEHAAKSTDIAWVVAHQLTSRDLLKKSHEIVVAIDAGHGGNDVGAQGLNGTQEKDVVFAIAKRLEQLVNTQPDMRAVMVRKGDYYIKLRDRMDIARVAKADLFVSIHADAIHDASVKGASVYMLSNNGASSEAARWLANNENSADLIGGVSLEDKDDVLASVLLDLSQSATKEASRSVASKILKYFNAIGKLHKNEVQKASFMVLKSPDIPSILIETAFISNPDEELELRSVEHQEKIATAVFKGIASYFKEYAPAGTRMASSQ
jgi:N-acetylmuramoyl-L-alanine amidase